MTVSASRNPDVSAARGIPDTVTQLRTTFRSGRTRPIEWRLAQLDAIVRLVTERESEFAEALAEGPRVAGPSTPGWPTSPP